MPKTALIFGANGQDGSYLSEFLASKGYVVVGAGLKSASPGFEYQICDVADGKRVDSLVSEVQPDETYNLAGMAVPRLCEEQPALAHSVNVQGTKNVISAIESHARHCRLFNASTAYIFSPGMGRKNEGSEFGPTGVYGKTKLLAHIAAAEARKRGIFSANGILFNHESPLRPPEYVTRKVTLAAAEFKKGLRTEPLGLGSLSAVRDWGFAGDYVKAMWLMLQAQEPKDYVIATGVGHSVAEWCEAAFGYVGLDYTKHVAFNDDAEKAGGDVLVGDPSLIKRDLNWSADTPFEKLVGMMVEADLHQGP